MTKWFSEEVDDGWIRGRQNIMSLLQDESKLNEIVQMVGMDALSDADRLKMEAARSIREDFLNQNSFDEVDTYSSLKKQYIMMKLVMSFYKELDALREFARDIKLEVVESFLKSSRSYTALQR